MTAQTNNQCLLKEGGHKAGHQDESSSEAIILIPSSLVAAKKSVRKSSITKKIHLFVCQVDTFSLCGVSQVKI